MRLRLLNKGTVTRSCLGFLVTALILYALPAYPGGQVVITNYSCTGSPQDFVVPPCITEITVKCWGGGGGGGGVDSYSGGPGGAGSFATAVIPTTPGETLSVYVGCLGGAGSGCSGGAPGGAGGWGYGIAGGGGNAGPQGCSGGGGGGGGSSGITRGTTLLLAGGGGGGGGGGGCTSGGGYGGYGATDGSLTTCTTGGGTGAASNANGTAGGTMGQDGGGGGGGGGGASNGGNGGNAPPPGPSCNSANDCGAGGAGAGNSYVPLGGTITFASGQTPGNSTDADLCGGCASGGNSQSNGGNGSVAIIYSSSPAAAFTANSVCFGNPVSFVDGSCNTVVGWLWDFGDGGPGSTLSNPTHTYAAPGTYSVTFIATDSFGVSDTAQNFVNVFELPAAGWSAPNVCAYNDAVFTDISTISTGALTWQWNFGDGQTSTAQNPVNTYASQGAYPVTLVATSDSGCTGTFTQTYYVHPVPQAGFTVANTCLYDPAVFSDASTLLSGSLTWNWDFGDGQTATDQNPSHLFAADGNYDAILIVTSDSGCTDTLQQTLTIYPVPAADYSTADVCVSDMAGFTDLSTVTSGSINAWQWSFGDATSSTQQSPAHLYPAYGTYTVRLIATSDKNCVDTAIKTIVIHPLPSVAFTVADVCVYDAAVFVNNSNIVLGNIATWSWDFGDGNTSILMSPNNLYNTEGTYTVKLVATSDKGCKDSTENQVTIFPSPQVAFTSDIQAACSPACIQFTDQSPVTAAVVSGWSWNFGDGSASNAQFPAVHCYVNNSIAAMSYDVQLVTTSTDGCSDTLISQDMIESWPNPIAAFTTSPVPVTILYPFVTLTNLSSGALDDPTVFVWDFGDTSALWTGFETVHVYPDQAPDSFAVELFVTNKWGCEDSVTHPVEILDDYALFIPNAFTPNGDGMNDFFTMKGIGLDNLVELEFSIYNRWGDLIYYYNDPSDPEWQGWDGSGNYGVEPAQNEVYVWVLKTRDALYNDHSRHQYMGYVTLIR